MSENARRDSDLTALGSRVIRIPDDDVIENLSGVLQAVLFDLERQPLTPPPSPLAGRGR